jgi:hypothetical protein
LGDVIWFDFLLIEKDMVRNSSFFRVSIDFASAEKLDELLAALAPNIGGFDQQQALISRSRLARIRQRPAFGEAEFRRLL